MEKNKNLNPQVCKIQYTEIENVAAIIRGSSRSRRKVTFLPGKTWKEIYGTPGKIVYEEKPSPGGSGVLYEQRADMFYPGRDKSNLTDFYDFEETIFLYKVTYTNRDEYLIGNLNEPASVVLDFSTVKGGGAISFICNSTEKAYIFEV